MKKLIFPITIVAALMLAASSCRNKDNRTNFPELTTNAASNITATSATIGGNVINTGTPTYTVRGVCYGTVENPVTTDNKQVVWGYGTGSFSVDVSGLTPRTKYYVRAYVVTKTDTYYGEQVSFTTGSPNDIPKYGGPVDKTHMLGTDEPIWLPELGFWNFESIKVFGSDPDVMTDLMVALGCKSYRLRNENILSKYVVNHATGAIEIEFNEDRLRFYRNYFTRLKELGFTLIIGQFDVFSKLSYKNEDENAYNLDMKAVETGFEMIARQFPEIIYWETGNETDRHLKNWNDPINIEKQIDLNIDYLYHASKGILKANPAAVPLTPGWCTTGNINETLEQRGNMNLKDFIAEVYRGIESGNFPRTTDTKSTDTDDYFRGFALHPYHFGAMDVNWKYYLDDLYAIVENHGDSGKKFFFTEMGWYDVDNPAQMALQEEWIRQLYDYCLDLWYVETCIYFRLFNNRNYSDSTFGLLYEASETQGIRPKGKALVLQQLFNRQGDLYMWNDIDKLNAKINAKDYLRMFND